MTIRVCKSDILELEELFEDVVNRHMASRSDLSSEKRAVLHGQLRHVAQAVFRDVHKNVEYVEEEDEATPEELALAKQLTDEIMNLEGELERVVERVRHLRHTVPEKAARAMRDALEWKVQDADSMVEDDNDDDDAPVNWTPAFQDVEQSLGEVLRSLVFEAQRMHEETKRARRVRRGAEMVSSPSPVRSSSPQDIHEASHEVLGETSGETSSPGAQLLSRLAHRVEAGHGPSEHAPS